jgi:hypothetical protein
LGRDFYSRGGVKAFILSKGRVFTRSQFQVIEITEEIKEEIAKVSSASLVPEQSIITADSVGAVTSEETEEHINPTNLTPLHRAPTESESTQTSEVAPQETLPADTSTTPVITSTPQPPERSRSKP